MDAATLQALEWPKLVDLAEAEARSEPGRAIVRSWSDPKSWAADLASARHRQLETLDATRVLDREGLWGPLTGLPDPDPMTEALAKGAVLELNQLAALRGWLFAIDGWGSTPRDEIQGEAIRRALRSLPDVHEPLRIIGRVLTPEGELSERASPKLAQLQTEVNALRREIQSKLDQLVHEYSRQGILQDSFVDLRDGRYVVPVKISHQGELDGIVFEASVSRQTVYIEPRQLEPLNNRLRQRQNDVAQEVYAILQETSCRLAPFAAEIASAAAILAHWDTVQARARLGRRFSGKTLDVVDERTFRLSQTAHPLLWFALEPSAIVRNDIDFGEPALCLLLTGPNTGGKTVLLKTLGLAALCARTGFPFPAAETPRVPFFDAFFADLGDPQSIERHLSSFSGHLLRYRELLEQLTDRALVLIDELNTATDPEEGAALGRAVLETVLERRALVVSTTHDPHLKALAVSDRRILSASMAFDEGARAPTYRLTVGIPGRSRALETAERLGLPREILDRARSYLSREHTQFEKMLSKLEIDTLGAARLRREAQAAFDEAARLKAEWFGRTQAAVGEMLEKARQRLRRAVEQAQDEIRGAVRRIDEAGSRRTVDVSRAQIQSAFGNAALQIDSALREEAPALASTLEAHAPAPAPVVAPSAPPALAPGARVRIPKWKSFGTVVELSGSRVKVAMGAIQMTLAASDVEAAPPAPDEAGPSPARMKVREAEPPPAPPDRIDLRGLRLEEAMAELGRYLDQAFRSGAYVEVTIVHGLGTGAIREGARELLARLPYVKEFRDGGPGGGGAGATRVEFDHL